MQQVWRISSAVFLAVCMLVHAGEAATHKKPKPGTAPSTAMTFAIVRSSVIGCEPKCPEWIAAEGELKPSTGAQFKTFLKKLGKQRLPVVITSPGGDVNSALAMGQMIRERKLDVTVGWTLYSGCGPTSRGCAPSKAQGGVYRGLIIGMRAYCFSACPFILAAGQRRVVGTGAFVGVHEITTQPFFQRVRYYETYRMVHGRKKVLSRKVVSRKNIVGKTTTKLSKPFDRKLRTYLNTMGVSLTMLDLLHLAPPSSIHSLTTGEMKSTNLATDFSLAADLMANSLCTQAIPADNCVKR
jgi:hypothetical protein